MNNKVVKNYKFGYHNIKLEQINDIDKLVDSISNDEFNQDERLPYWAEVWPSAVAFSNNSILELGCGTGIVGISATKSGADVTFSDYENEALNFTRNNYFLNFGKRAKTVLLDWRNPDHDKQYEIIIAADILYENRFLEPVYNTLNMLLTENGKVYIAEPNRTIAKPFFDLMKDGYAELNNLSLNYKNKSVTLYKFQKC